MSPLPPREAAEFISARAKDVKISTENVEKLSGIIFDIFKKGDYSLKKYKEHAQNPKIADDSAIEWIFFADVLNFSFWSDNTSDKYMVKYRDMECTGYWSLCAAMNRTIDKGVPLTKAEYFATLTSADWDEHFKSDSEEAMPLKELRLKNLHDAGKTLLEKYDGSFVNVVKKADHSAQKLLEIVIRDFPSFDDTVVFEGEACAFYKRAQILIADIWACFEGKDLGRFDDIDTLTMFADYRIPQALAYYGVLEYSDELMKYLREGHLMKTGDTYEVELRGCSIHAVELIREQCDRLKSADPALQELILNSVMVDHFLWDYRRDHAKLVDAKIPMHKIRCIYY